MVRFVAVVGLAIGAAVVSGAKDICKVGSYYDEDADDCFYCMNGPLGSYYTANGNNTNVCPYEMCESCPSGQYNKGCGYDDQTNDPPSICFSMTEFADICSAGPSYCAVIPTDYTAYDTCSDYCADQRLDCLATYETEDDETCPDTLFEATAGSCDADMTSTSICACDLATCEADYHQTGILRCDYYADTLGNCPEAGSTVDLADQIWAVQNCRVSCGACVSGDSWGAGECTGCTEIEDGTEGVFYSSDGERSDSCTVSDCSQQCFLGEYNAGCGYDAFTEDTFACALCKDTCGAGNYISEVCDGSGFSDSVECTECDESCDIGYYIASTCDGTTTYDSTECLPCTAACNPGYYMDGETCDGTAYESQATCVECTRECPAGEFPTGSCDGTGDSDEVSCLDCYTDCDKDCTECSCFEPCFRTTVLGGSGNWALNTFDAVGGGYQNQAGFLESDTATGYGDDDEYNVVIGGTLNTAGGMYTTITGGEANTAFGMGNVIFAGTGNVAAVSDSWSIALEGATIGGGKSNTASGDYSVALAGEENKATFAYSGVLGGYKNEATGAYSVILGGMENSVRGSWAGVGGGKLNKAWANYATCAGGYLGKASARFSVVLGGSKNTAKGRYSFAVGFNTKATKDYSAVLGFSGSSCKDNGAGTFNICADYVYINGYDVTALLESANGRRSRRLADGSEVSIGNDAEMRRLVRDRGLTLEATELEHEVTENDLMLKQVSNKMNEASEKLLTLNRLLQPSSLRSR